MELAWRVSRCGRLRSYSYCLDVDALFCTLFSGCLVLGAGLNTRFVMPYGKSRLRVLPVDLPTALILLILTKPLLCMYCSSLSDKSTRILTVPCRPFANAIKTAVSFHKSNLVDSPICPFCNNEVLESTLHMYEECPRWSTIRDKLPKAFGGPWQCMPLGANS